jgi:hypothetical protein
VPEVQFESTITASKRAKTVHVLDGSDTVNGIIIIIIIIINIIIIIIIIIDRLYGLVVSVPGYRSRGPGFESWRYQIF